MKQNQGSDWSGDDWDDGSGSGLSDCKNFPGEGVYPRI